MTLPAAAKVSAQNVRADGAPQTFQYLSGQYFEQVYFKYSPTAGTSAGLHQYDSQLEDYSAANVQRQIAALHEWEKKISAIDPSELDAEPAADRDILLNSIRGALLELEVVRGWEKNPDSYSSGVTNSIFVLMERPYAPANVRLRAVVARERLIPQVFVEARKNLKDPPRIYTEIALEQIDDLVSFFQTDVPSAFADADGRAGEGGVRQVQRCGDRGAPELQRVAEERSAAAFQRGLPLRRGYLPKGSGL